MEVLAKLRFSIDSINLTNQSDYPKKFLATLNFEGKTVCFSLENQENLKSENLIVNSKISDIKNRLHRSPVLVEVIQKIYGVEKFYSRAEIFFKDNFSLIPTEEFHCFATENLLKDNEICGNVNVRLSISMNFGCCEENYENESECASLMLELLDDLKESKKCLSNLNAKYAINKQSMINYCDTESENDITAGQQNSWRKQKNQNYEKYRLKPCSEIFGDDKSSKCDSKELLYGTEIDKKPCCAQIHLSGCWEKGSKEEYCEIKEIDTSSENDCMNNQSRNKTKSKKVVQPCSNLQKRNPYNICVMKGDTFDKIKYEKCPVCNQSLECSLSSQKCSTTTTSCSCFKTENRKSTKSCVEKIKHCSSLNFSCSEFEKKPSKGNTRRTNRKCNPSEFEEPHLTNILKKIQENATFIKNCREMSGPCGKDPCKPKSKNKSKSNQKNCNLKLNKIENICKNKCHPNLECENKKKRKSKLYVHKFGKCYPGIIVGHQKCQDACRMVPKNMGWLWNIETLGIRKRRPGWRPGAVMRPIKELMCYFLELCPCDHLPQKKVQPCYKIQYDNVDDPCINFNKNKKEYENFDNNKNTMTDEIDNKLLEIISARETKASENQTKQTSKKGGKIDKGGKSSGKDKDKPDDIGTPYITNTNPTEIIGPEKGTKKGTSKALDAVIKKEQIKNEGNNPTKDEKPSGIPTAISRNKKRKSVEIASDCVKDTPGKTLVKPKNSLPK